MASGISSQEEIDEVCTNVHVHIKPAADQKKVAFSGTCSLEMVCVRH